MDCSVGKLHLQITHPVNTLLAVELGEAKKPTFSVVVCNCHEIVILISLNFYVPEIHSNCSTIRAGDQLRSYTSEKAVVFSNGY